MRSGDFGAFALFFAADAFLFSAFDFFSGAVDFLFEISFGAAEFTHALAEATGEFWEFLGSKEEQDDHENDHHFGGLKPKDTGDERCVHKREGLGAWWNDFKKTVTPRRNVAKETFGLLRVEGAGRRTARERDFIVKFIS